MARKLKSDRILFVAAILMVCASVVMVYSASAAVALEKYKDPNYFLIRQGYALAGGKGVVVLAPACASFDWFRDYAERGRVFKEAVRALEEELKTR